MRFSAPSFSFKEGEVKEIWGKAEAKSLMKEARGAILIVHPGINMLQNPREWASLFSSAIFVILCGSKEEKAILTLQKELDNVVYSPMRKTLAGAVLVDNLEEAYSIYHSLTFEGSKTITINNTEGEIR